MMEDLNNDKKSRISKFWTVFQKAYAADALQFDIPKICRIPSPRKRFLCSRTYKCRNCRQTSSLLTHKLMPLYLLMGIMFNVLFMIFLYVSECICSWSRSGQRIFIMGWFYFFSTMSVSISVCTIIKDLNFAILE